jgi:hypothetical protein
VVAQADLDMQAVARNIVNDMETEHRWGGHLIMLTKATAGMDRRFETVVDLTEDRFDTVEERFDRIELRLDRIDPRFDTVEKRFDTVDERFAEVEKRFDGMDKRMDLLGDDVRKVLAYVETIAGYAAREESNG